MKWRSFVYRKIVSVSVACFQQDIGSLVCVFSHGVVGYIRAYTGSTIAYSRVFNNATVLIVICCLASLYA